MQNILKSTDSQWGIREEQPTQAYSFLRGSFHCFGRTFTEPLGIRYDNLFRNDPSPSAKIVRFKKKKEDMRRLKYIMAILILMLILIACGNKSRQTEPTIYDDEPTIEQSMSDTATVPVLENIPKSEKIQSASSGIVSSHSHASGNYDNMRGFDPASEDDMDDNGMSRYIENNDEEGWD